jgi:2,5-diketo-D-gluconate reductase A
MSWYDITIWGAPHMRTALGLTPFQLNDGHELPAIGLGTFGMTGEEGIAALTAGLRNGYRLLDTAVGYHNEAEVGEAIRRSDVPATDVVVTTKIPGRGLGYDEARRNISQSRHTLGLEQIGLHLIHWPIPRLDRYVDTWRAMVDAQSDGEIRSIGVSNFTPLHLARIIDATGVIPAVNQIELHPHFPQDEQRRVHRDLGICTQSWSPLGRGRELLSTPEALRPAVRLGVTPGQVVLRWHHQLELLPIPRSTDSQRQRDNLDISAFELTAEEVAALTALRRGGGRLWNGDPETTGFM